MEYMAIIIQIASPIITGLLVAILVRKINRHDKDAEKRQQQLIECRSLDKGYADATGDLAYKIAMSAREKDMFNGELNKEIQDYEYIQGKRAKFYNNFIGENVVKGG